MKYVSRNMNIASPSTDTSVAATFPELFVNGNNEATTTIMFRADADISFKVNDASGDQDAFLLKTGEIFDDNSAGITDIFITNAGATNLYFMSRFGGFMRVKNG